MYEWLGRHAKSPTVGLRACGTENSAALQEAHVSSLRQRRCEVVVPRMASMAESSVTRGWLANPDAGSHGGDHHSSLMLLRACAPAAAGSLVRSLLQALLVLLAANTYYSPVKRRQQAESGSGLGQGVRLSTPPLLRWNQIFGSVMARLDRFPALPGSHQTSQVTAGLVEFVQQPSVWLLGQVDSGCTESMFGCLYEMRIQIADASTWTFGWLHACC